MNNAANRYGLDVATLLDRLGYRPDNVSMMFDHPLPETEPMIAPKTGASADDAFTVTVCLFHL